jgi:hypothetical protein
MVTRTERMEPDSGPHGSGLLGPPNSEYWSSESVMIGLQGCFKDRLKSCITGSVSLDKRSDHWQTGLLEGGRHEGANLALFCCAQLQMQVTSLQPNAGKVLVRGSTVRQLVHSASGRSVLAFSLLPAGRKQGSVYW